MTQADGVFFQGDYRRAEVCCADLATAFQSGTDAEGYGALVSLNGRDQWRFQASVALPSCCPWCGERNAVRLL